MKRAALLLSALLFNALLWACQSQTAKDGTPLIGAVTEHNGLKTSGRLIVKTPSILRITPSKPVPPDIQAAIDHYDGLLGLSTDAQTRAEALRRSADLRVRLVDAGSADEVELQKAITNYQRLLAEFPNNPDNDRALYQLARAYQLAGDADQAIASLAQLSKQYPESARAGDALFRVAELLYQHERYAEAEPEYRAIVNLGPGTTFFEPAQYKYGWSLYKQSKYEQALPVFLAVLDRELPPGRLQDPAAALAAVAQSKSEFASDSLRVVSLSFAALGGGKAVNEYFSRSGEPRYSTLIYEALGSLLLDKQRYSDAAETYAAFVQRHPGDELGPNFQSRAIAAYQRGGFSDLVVHAKESFVNNYAPDGPYWGSKPPPAEIMSALRQDVDELGSYYHAKAQQTPVADAKARRLNFVRAAGWYRRSLDLFPSDPHAADVNLLYADALLDGGQTREAAAQYLNTAYNYKENPKSQESAYAAVQAYQQLAKEVSPAEHAAVLHESAEAGIKLADHFPRHPQAPLVLTRVAEDLYEAKDLDAAVAAAKRVLQANPPAAADLRSTALGVVADARFAQKKYGEAESNYSALLGLMGASDSRRKIAVEQLAASVYKQAEAARDAGNLRAAANGFQRVGRVAPDASIRTSADYDAATAFVALQDWAPAEAALESFRARNPMHALAADVDKKLAVAYQKDRKPALAAEAYARIAQRPGELPDTRREAAWMAAQIYDQAGMSAQSARSYDYYLANFPQPLEHALQARRRLADIALNDVHDSARYLRSLHDIIDADKSAGVQRTGASRQMAAQASLELGRLDAANARQFALTAPLAKSVQKRKAATEAAVATLARAADYGFAEVTTAATYEIGLVYRDFGHAVMASERPGRLKGDELEQYNLLLEEQADPFEQKAIQAHEANLQRMRQGLWNDWIRRSAWALAELAPGKYGKHEQREDSYDAPF